MDSLLDVEDRLFSQQALSAPWGELGRSATLGVVSLLGKLTLTGLNRLHVAEGRDAFLQHTLRREPGRGLITVCNHTSTLDDPFIFSAILPWGFFCGEHRHHANRWALCAHEICYANPLLGQFFQSGKVLPIQRGGGLSQPILRTVAGEVARGRWAHVFPEGRVVYEGRLGPLRWGVGKLVCDATVRSDRPPVVLPFYHSGMGRVMPRRGRLPRVGHEVTVLVGQPVELEDLTCRCGREGEDQRAVWRDITQRVGEALRALEARAPPNPDQAAAAVAAAEAEGGGGKARRRRAPQQGSEGTRAEGMGEEV